ncbi:Importin subunit alpha [Pelomyxa schiedti]|nr:Importin subunit alpha [Pelomyxa schiedti]
MAALELEPTTTVESAAWATYSNDRNVAFTGMVHLRMLLCSEEPPIAEVIETGVLPRLIQFLSLSDDTNFQCEALWALTNICSGSNTKQTEEVIICGILPQLLDLLSSSPDVDVCEQATWALSNICGDCAVHRDYVLHLGFFPALFKAMARFQNQRTFLRKAAWAISNGCRGRPTPDISHFKPSDAGESISPLAMLAALLQCGDMYILTLLQCGDMYILSEASWALSYLTDSPSCIKLIISTGAIIPSLIRLLSVGDMNIQVPALRALGNVATARA